MDEVSIIVLSTERGFAKRAELKADDTSGVLAMTWPEREERNLGGPADPRHSIRHLNEVERPLPIR